MMRCECAMERRLLGVPDRVKNGRRCLAPASTRSPDLNFRRVGISMPVAVVQVRIVRMTVTQQPVEGGCERGSAGDTPGS